MLWIAAVRLQLRDKETLHHPKYLCQADPVFKWPRVAARGGPLEDTLTALWRVLEAGTQGRRVHSTVNRGGVQNVIRKIIPSNLALHNP